MFDLGSSPRPAFAIIMAFVLACGVTGCCVRRAPTASLDRPRDVDPALYLVESSVAHRVVVFRGCSPEHCFTETFLEWLDDASTGREPLIEVKARTPIAEANGVGAFVKEARWMSEKGKPVLYLTVANSYSDEVPPFVLRVEPDREGRYHVTCEVH